VAIFSPTDKVCCCPLIFHPAFSLAQPASPLREPNPVRSGPAARPAKAHPGPAPWPWRARPGDLDGAAAWGVSTLVSRARAPIKAPPRCAPCKPAPRPVRRAAAAGSPNRRRRSQARRRRLPSPPRRPC
jgi:hypothetical protein